MARSEPQHESASDVSTEHVQGGLYLNDVGSIDAWVLQPNQPALHLHVNGLPAIYYIPYDADSPVVLEVQRPLKFDAVTLFPRLWTQGKVELEKPKILIAPGVPLHRVSRDDDDICTAFIGFGDVESNRARVFSAELLGHYKPDLEIGPFSLPCSHLGGRSLDWTSLTTSWPTKEWEEAEFIERIALSPEEGGSYGYDGVDFDIDGVRVEGNESGAWHLASYRAYLLEQSEVAMKVRLVVLEQFMIEGWVRNGVFEPTEHFTTHAPDLAYGGGGGWSLGPQTFCLGRLKKGTQILSSASAVWATVTEEVEGVFLQGKGEEPHQLVNLRGDYAYSFCGTGAADPKREDGLVRCIADAHVQQNDVQLDCGHTPGPK